VLYSRSNIQFKNTAGQPISLRFTSRSKQHLDPVEVSIKDLDIQGLSVELACDPELCISFKHGNLPGQDWSTELLVRELLSDRKHVHHDTTTTLVLIVSHDVLKNKADEVDDYLIEIVSGIRIVNALPYHVEVKCNETQGAKSHSLSPKIIRLNPGRCTLVPMIRVGSVFALRVIGKPRAGSPEEEDEVSSVFKRKFSRPVDWVEWSSSIDLRDVFHVNASNVNEETIDIPCKFFPNLKVKLRKIRDPSKDESFAKRYTSTPTIEIYTDIWIQNNSGIHLAYRLKSRSLGAVEVVNDSFCGYNAISSRVSGCEKSGGGSVSGMSGGGQKGSPNSGPILGLVAMSSIQLKCELSQESDEGQMISLQDFSNVSIQLPNLSQESKHKWSPKVRLSDTTFKSYELPFGNLYFGLSLQPGFGVFHRTKILVITPRYVIQNLSSLLVNIFPVRIWKRYRISSTGAESECKFLWFCGCFPHSTPPPLLLL
jgi:hypothetical protein